MMRGYVSESFNQINQPHYLYLSVIEIEDSPPLSGHVGFLELQNRLELSVGWRKLQPKMKPKNDFVKLANGKQRLSNIN